MKRVQKNLIVALVLLGGGGAAALYTLKTEVKTADIRFDEQRKAQRLFEFGRLDVAKGRLTSPSSTFAFTRDELFGWRITDPVDWPGDGEPIEAMLDRMAGLLVETELSADPTPEDLARSGLDDPKVRLQVDLKDGRSLELLVGPRNKLADRYPVTDGAATRLGLSSKEFYWTMDRGLVEYRQDRLFPFAPDAVEQVELRRGDAVHARMVRDGAAWRVTGAGLDAPIPGDEGVIGLFLVALTKHTKAERYLDDDYDPATEAAKYGLDAPLFTVSLRTGETTRTAVVGKFQETGDEEGTVTVWVEGTRTVAAAQTALKDTLDRTAADYRNLTLSRFSPSAVRRVRFETAGRPAIELARRGDGWHMTAPKAGPAKAWKVDAAVRPFGGLKVLKWRTDRPSKAQLKDWFLEPWSRRLVAYGEGDAIIADVRVGNRPEEGLLFARAASAPQVGHIKETKVVAWPASADDLLDPDAAAPAP